MEDSDQSTFEVLKNSILSQPRMMGTKGEKETTQFLQDFLNKHELAPFTEEIDWTTAIFNGRKLLFFFLGFFICLFNIFLWLIPTSINGIVSIATTLLSFVLLLLFTMGVLNDKLPFLGKQAKGKNVICEINPKKQSEKPATVYLVAHTDSISTNMPKFGLQYMAIMLLGFLLVFLLTIASSIISLIIYYENNLETNLAIKIINIIILVLGIIIVLIVITSLFIKEVNTSPGACDNGSGSAILLSLATFLKQHSLKNTQVKIIWCAAEEWGIYGSKSYVKNHKEEIIANKDNSYVINIDMVGSELAYLGKFGLIRKKELNTKLNDLIEETAKENKIEARRFNS